MRHRVEQAGATSPISRPDQARSTGPQVLRNHRRIQGGYGWRIVSLLCLLGIGLGAGACVPQKTACEPSDKAEDCDGFFTLQIDNPRFEFPASQPVVRGHDFWLRAGDEINARWDSYIFFIAAPGVTCNENTTPSPPACARCDFLDLKPRECRAGFAFSPGIDLLNVLEFEGFMSQSPPRVIARLPFPADVKLGVASVMPTGNATLHLTAPIGRKDKLAEVRVFVIASGTSQSVTYQINPLPQPGVMDATFYSGTVPISVRSNVPSGVPNPELPSDNFSDNLHIGKVRVMKGTPAADMITGKLKLENASVVHPSRLVFIAGYQADEVYRHDGFDCYADSSADGDLDLSRCRSVYNEPGSSSLVATPAYLDAEKTQLLTWVAEFKATEGGVAPTLATGEVLAIEFTIEGN